MQRKGKVKPAALFTWVALAAVILTGVLMADAKWSFLPGEDTLSQIDGTIVTNTLSGSLDVSSCPDDGDTSLVVDVQNILNSTNSEGFDTTAYLTSKESGNRVVLTDTINPTASLINCGEEYQLEVVRANAADGDNSKIQTIISGPNAAIDNGVISFTPTKSNYNLRVGVAQHGVLSFFARDNDIGDPMCYGGATPCTTFQTDGVSFTSTTNGTAKAVGTDGYLDIQMKARATLSDNDFTDYYTLILVEAPFATWQEPSVDVDGVSVSNVKGKGVLTGEEETAFSGYEYIYKISNSILDGNDGIVIDFFMQAKSGVNPSADPEIDFASAGRFLSVDGVTTKVGAADDTSTNAVVFDVQDVTLDIS